MAVRKVREKEWTKDGRMWIYETRYAGKTYKSKKFHTKHEAIDAERSFLNDIETKSKPTEMTLGDLFDEHQEYQKDKVKYTTMHNYYAKKVHFESLMGTKINELNIHHFEEWKKEINAKVRLDGKPLATRTKNDLYKYLKSVLNYGTKWHDFNFTSMYNKMINFNNPNELPKEMMFYTFDEFEKFINVEDDIKWKCVFETLYYCGLRRGELRGLVWKNIDLSSKELYVKQNVVNVSGDSGYWVITTPKTRTSTRKIPMPDILVNHLKMLKEESNMYYGFNDDWFVFGTITPLHPDILRKRKNDNAKKAGVKQIRIHDFRHSCASLLINNGANITIVAQYLGHAKLEETLNTYSHVFEGKLNDVVNMLNKINNENK